MGQSQAILAWWMPDQPGLQNETLISKKILVNKCEKHTILRKSLKSQGKAQDSLFWAASTGEVPQNSRCISPETDYADRMREGKLDSILRAIVPSNPSTPGFQAHCPDSGLANPVLARPAHRCVTMAAVRGISRVLFLEWLNNLLLHLALRCLCLLSPGSLLLELPDPFLDLPSQWSWPWQSSRFLSHSCF